MIWAWRVPVCCPHTWSTSLARKALCQAPSPVHPKALQWPKPPVMSSHPHMTQTPGILRIVCQQDSITHPYLQQDPSGHSSSAMSTCKPRLQLKLKLGAVQAPQKSHPQRRSRGRNCGLRASKMRATGPKRSSQNRPMMSETVSQRPTVRRPPPREPAGAQPHTVTTTLQPQLI